MLCRLCIDDSNDFLNIFDENGEQLGIAGILALHFWFKPQPDDCLSTAICSTCWLKVNDFHQFYILIEQTHNKLDKYNVKHESLNNIENEFVDPGVDVKEEFIEMCKSNHDSDSEALNPLCGLDCDNRKGENKVCELSEQSTDDGDKEEPVIIAATLSSRPERKKRICIVEKASPAKRQKRANRKDAFHAASPEKINNPLKKLKEKHCIKSKQEDDDMVKKYIQMNCELCTYVGDDYITLRKHFRTQHPQIKGYIRCCSKKLFDRLDIIQHAYKHDNPDFFKCTTCQKSFSEQSTLARHMVAVHGSEEDLKFHCDLCPKKFARQKLLELHKNSHVPMDERPFACDQCPNSRFANKDLLKYHIASRHQRAPHVCHVCAKEIRDKASFEKHVRSHFEKNGPKLKCPIDDCDHWLKDEHNLRRHMRLHTAESKILKCDECGRECKDKSALSNHKRRVHSNVVFTCEECKKTFKRAIYLREHMAQHTGEILYKCPFCTRTFNSNANMHAHKKKMHSAEWDNWRKTNNTSLLEISRQHQHT